MLTPKYITIKLSEKNLRKYNKNHSLFRVPFSINYNSYYDRYIAIIFYFIITSCLKILINNSSKKNNCEELIISN